jgi:hypothetical protein
LAGRVTLRADVDLYRSIDREVIAEVEVVVEYENKKRMYREVDPGHQACKV